MFGLLALGLICIMIYSLIRNALKGKQLSKTDEYQGTIELLIPIGPRSEFHLEAWIATIPTFSFTPGQLKIHILIDGHHNSLHAWQELKNRLPYLEIHTFTQRPAHVEGSAWMIDQFMPRVSGSVVIVGDSEIVPTGAAFLSVARNVKEKNRSYFVVPQTAQTSLLGESVAVLNTTLAFISVFGQKRWRKNFSHSLLGISSGWMAMPLEIFRALDLKGARFSGWKETIARQWDEQGKDFFLAFGEKQLVRHYPETLGSMATSLVEEWQDLWNKRSKRGFYCFLTILFLWSFPVVFFITHPLWSVPGIMLLVLYRFFSKIVFQESWAAVILHPFGCLYHIMTLLWWGWNQIRAGKRITT